MITRKDKIIAFIAALIIAVLVVASFAYINSDILQQPVTKETLYASEHGAFSTYLEKKEPINVPEYFRLNVTATHYTAFCNTGCIGITYTGIDVSDTITPPETNGRRIVAVDPNVIPLHSLVLIDGEEFQAEDTGGAIKGNRIDILVRTKKEAYQLGVKELEIIVIPESET